jgi:hypothetical protein
MAFIEENQKERLKFVDMWSRYALGHSDREWSRQQNVIINSCIRGAKMTKKEYLGMKA